MRGVRPNSPHMTMIVLFNRPDESRSSIIALRRSVERRQLPAERAKLFPCVSPAAPTQADDAHSAFDQPLRQGTSQMLSAPMP